jgi:site-specific DNA recombinase
MATTMAKGATPLHRKVTKLPRALEFPKISSVGIYCRVSSTHAAQLASLAQQASYLTKLVMGRPGWWLADIYLDVQSGGAGANRPEYQRLLRDCREGRLDLVLVKSISRFGRDTAELVTILRELKSLGIAVMFDNEKISTDDADNEHIITIIEAYAQAETESRVRNTRWGLEKRAQDGTLGLNKRRCYGYTINDQYHLWRQFGWRLFGFHAYCSNHLSSNVKRLATGCK